MKRKLTHGIKVIGTLCLILIIMFNWCITLCESDDLHSDDYDKSDDELYLDSLVGKYTIQFIEYLPDVVEIGVSDAGDENVRFIMEQIRNAGIDTDSIKFVLTSDNNDWGKTYDHYDTVADIEDALYDARFFIVPAFIVGLLFSNIIWKKHNSYGKDTMRAALARCIT